MKTTHATTQLVLSIALASAALVGCGNGDDAGPAATAKADATYYRDLEPLVADKCVGCHTEGGIAPFSLETYDDVKAMLGPIRAAVASRTMPPWLADPGCSQYEGDRSLTDDQIATVTGWIDRGAPAGDPREAAAEGGNSEQGLSRVDRTLTMPVAYTPQIAPDDYRCFLIDWPESHSTFVTGFRANPGNAATVHHVIAYLIPPNSVQKYDDLDEQDETAGYTCFGGPGGGIDPNTRFIGSWAPGARGGDLPEGTGLRVEPGSKIALQVHYNSKAGQDAAPDKTSIDVKLDDEVAKEGTWQFFTDLQWVLGTGMEIPAHTADVTHSYAMDPTPMISQSGPFTIHEAGLHMHTHGRESRLAIERAGGADECILSISDWNFHWQGTYALGAPKTFQPGDQLSISCTFDNETAQDLAWGEGTGDEMCLGLVYYTVP